MRPTSVGPKRYSLRPASMREKSRMLLMSCVRRWLVQALSVGLAHAHHQVLVGVLALELVLEVVADEPVMGILAVELEAEDSPRLSLAGRPRDRVLPRAVGEGADRGQHLRRDFDLAPVAHAQRAHDH